MADAARDLEDRFKVDIIIIRANQLPDLRATLGNRRFYVTVDDRSAQGKKRTKAIRSAENSVIWNEKFDGLEVLPSSQIIVSLYAKHRVGSDDLIGTIKINTTNVTDASFTLAAASDPAPIVVLTIRVYARQPSTQRSNVSAQHVGQTDAIQLESAESSRVLAEPAGEESQPAAPLTRDALEDIQEGAVKDTKDALNAVKNMHLLDEWNGTLENMQWLMDMVKGLADIHPLAKAAWGVVCAIPKAFSKQIEIDTSVQDLLKAIQDALGLTKERGLQDAIKPYSNQALLLKAMLMHITTCCEIVIAYAKDRRFRTRLLKNITGRTRDEIKGLCTSLAKLRDDFLGSSIISTQITIVDMHNTLGSIGKGLKILLDEESYKAGFNDLPYDSGWSSTTNKRRCLEGTRTKFIDYITKWIHDPSGLRGLVLFGQLGMGKSTIAHEIAYRFYLEGSYFSFSRAKKSTQKDHHLLTTIICDLADRHSAFKRSVGELITDNRPLRTSDDIDQLFTTLLLGPLEKVGGNEISRVVVIVIDALDESGNPRKVAEFLSRFIAKLPPNFRVIITSRPENTILPSFPSDDNHDYAIVQMIDDILATEIHDDILLYLKAELSSHIFEEHGKSLLEEAGGLFQWAAVACGYINEPPAGYTENDCLRGLLGRRSGDKPYTQELQSTKLYKLYDEVLSGYFTSKITRPRFCTVMGQLLCAFEPLSIMTLTGLRRFIPGEDRDEGSVLAVLKFMGSLLSNAVSHDRSLPVFPLHVSFRDFLTDTENVHPFSVNLVTAHKELTHACLDIMIHDLSFNICHLESSHLRNSEIEDLQSRNDKFISPALFYACRFWDDHMGFVPFDIVIFGKLKIFFETRFLFWLEVLSVTSTVALAAQAISASMKWLQSGLLIIQPQDANRVKTLLDVVADGRMFLRSFGNVIATSAPHIYVSALFFAPISSHIYQIHSPIYRQTQNFKHGQSKHWLALEMFITAPSGVHCVEFSPDGECIATGLDDGSICLWNATTGILQGKPFTGHEQRVCSVAFSLDGQQIISGSNDSTIRLWNVATGRLQGTPWVGHDDGVNSVAFSPNGHYVVSGSVDKTMHIWNTADGSMNGSALYGHTDSVTSVVFSLDGNKIISGSRDCTVGVWKFHVEKEAAIEVTLQFTLRAPGELLCVAISPNGQQIAAGSVDNNVYMWDNPLESTERKPLVGQRFAIFSLKFSSDGQRLVSGSGDNKFNIMLWDTATKMSISKRLLGHTLMVSSIAVSADGQRFASGSFDSTIGVWNASAAEHTKESGTGSTGHNTLIRAIGSSSVGDQRLVASSADDGTVCLWDATTGNLIASPSQKLTDGMSAVAFSPNGRQVVSRSWDGSLRLWNILDNNTVEPVGIPLTERINFLNAVAFSSDGRHIVSASAPDVVQVWNIATGTLEITLCSGSSVNSLGFSPDSCRLFAGLPTGAVCVWDISEKPPKERQLNSGKYIGVVFVAFLCDKNKIIVCSSDATVRFWNISTGEMDRIAFDLPKSGDGGIYSVALSPDSLHLAVASEDDWTINVWNLTTRTKENAYPLVGHVGRITSLAFTSDGQQLVSCSADSTIRIWSLSIGAAVLAATFERGFDVNWSALDNEGWARGTKGELLLWVPQAQRSTFRHSSIILTTDPHRTSIDYSSFAQGKDWALTHCNKQ